MLLLLIPSRNNPNLTSMRTPMIIRIHDSAVTVTISVTSPATEVLKSKIVSPGRRSRKRGNIKQRVVERITTHPTAQSASIKIKLNMHPMDKDTQGCFKDIAWIQRLISMSISFSLRYFFIFLASLGWATII